MRLSAKSWLNYISKLSDIEAIAGATMQKYINKNGTDDVYGLIDYAYALATKYGEASGALACEMYDAIAKASGKSLPAAEMAPTASLKETSIAVRGTMLNEQNSVPDTVSRLVKQTAADTTLKNALRDGAKFAWIPHGDTCAFCLTIASRGWQNMSKKALKNGHAEHIHANCNCEYAISFDKDPYVEGYDPKYYEDLYYGADGKTPKDKINYIRRTQYAELRGRGKNAVLEWASDKIAKSLGSNYEDFKGLVNSSANRGLYNQYSEDATYIKDNNGYYRKGAKAVHYGLENHEGMNKFETLAHEVGHMFDDSMGRLPGLEFTEVDLINQKCIIGSGINKTLTPVPSNCDEFLKALRKDMEALRPKVKDRSIRAELLETTAKRNATAGIQDALDGFYDTQSSGLLPWGHGSRYYNREYNRRISAFGNEKALKEAYTEMGFDASNQTKAKRLSRIYETASEAWANMSSAVTVGGDTLAYMKEYMPETYSAYIRIVGGE